MTPSRFCARAGAFFPARPTRLAAARDATLARAVRRAAPALLLGALAWLPAHARAAETTAASSVPDAACAAAASPASWSEYSVPVEGTEVRVMQADNGRRHRVYVWAPPGPAPAHGRPVIYVLDGETTFMLVRDLALALAEHYPGTELPVVVALGYDYAQPYSAEALRGTLVERTFDYTPAVPESLLGESFNAQPWPPSGGADEFLDFIEWRLKPAIAGEHAIDPDRQVLMGHSFGGLLTLHALFTRPYMFDTYVASSPSLWYGAGYLGRAQARFAEAWAGRLAGKRLLLTVGDLEQSRAPDRGEWGRAEWLAGNRMVEGLEQMVRRLEPLRALGLELRSRRYENQTHLSVKPPALDEGLRFALRPPTGAGRSSPAGAASAAGRPPVYRMPARQRWEMDGHEVSVILPVFPDSLQAPEAGYPVVFHLGGSPGIYADSLRRLEGAAVTEPAIVVGVRSLDADRAAPGEAALAAIGRAVLPCLRARYPVDASRLSLLAHGRTAAAALRELGRDGSAFGTVALLHPDAEAIEAAAADPGLAEHARAARGRRLLVMVGDAPNGRDAPGSADDSDRVPAAAQALVGRLRAGAPRAPEAGVRVLHGEDNVFSIAAVAEALMFSVGRAASLRAVDPGP
ncbi:hypothetical protein B1992_13275 [Pseudoxanthomonas broegbernensis]|uniref:Alpha/beta hydrolase n=1 Tax=Pseudoxanthomonas broegbernensis TaxID=83619 RepID=A0A7V8K5Z9_9GAMM|nr:alpha/beta hydrolase-fold protein [Pseudoxanthomonas broegbernensis]KAF1685089.1 hypothetical protein B1992_13275 [Pseudoxanthomonas broegbernensis]MBB6066248.1 putative alpha/beta superfamily hydrolase [Pseudoxanthomonas broegbernensis]